MEEDYTSYTKLLSLNCSEEEALVNLKLQEKPPTGQKRYQELLDLWCREGFTHLYQFLLYYNALDTKPLVTALQKFTKQFKDQYQVDLLQYCTIPSLAFTLLMKDLEDSKEVDMHTNFFALLDKESSEFIDRSINGGVSHSFCHLMLSSHTKLNQHMHGEQSETCQKIIAWDANGLYSYVVFTLILLIKTLKMFFINFSGVMGRLSCHCLGYYAIRRRENHFRLDTVMNKMKNAMRWLTYVFTIQNRKRNFMRTAMTDFGEKSLLIDGKRYMLDGYEPATKTHYSYCGDLWHSCPRHTDHSAMHPIHKDLTHGQVYERHMEWHKTVSSHPAVDDTVIMWECEWKEFLRDHPKLAEIVNGWQLGPPEVEHEMSEKRCLELIAQGALHGFCEVDLAVPKHLWQDFAEFPPFFQNGIVTQDDLDPVQKEYDQTHGNKMKNGRRMLLSLMKADRIVIPTELLRFYMDLNIEVKALYNLLQFSHAKPFSKWLDTLAQNHRDAVVEKSTVKDLTQKLIGK